MFSVDLSTREWDGHVVALGEEPSAARNMARRDPATVVLFPGCGDDR